MENGFIVVAISENGVEKVHLYHGENKKNIKKVLDIYERIMPILKRINRLVLENQCLQG